jgi:hypothetical protein
VSKAALQVNSGSRKGMANVEIRERMILAKRKIKIISF